jgi:hypothetical protein
MSQLVGPLGGIGGGGGGGGTPDDGSVTFPKLSTDVASAFEGTTSEIFLKVTTTGSDTPTLTRPARVLGGDKTSEPYLTIQAAIDALPKILRHPVVVNVEAGTFAGAVIDGFLARSMQTFNQPMLRLRGAMALSTLASGPNTATATSGSATTLTFTGAGWTVDDLKGRFVRIASGPGAPTTTPSEYASVVGLIKSNTADTMTVTLTLAKYPTIGNTVITTPAAGSVFEIIESSSIVQLAVRTNVTDCVQVMMCNAFVAIEQLSIGAVGQTRALHYALTQQGDVRYCKFSVAPSATQIQMFQTQRTFIISCYSTLGSFYFAQRAGNNTNVNGCIAVGSAAGSGIRYNVSPGLVSVTDNVLSNFTDAIQFDNCWQIFVDRNTLSWLGGSGIIFARCVYVNSNTNNTGAGTAGASVGLGITGPIHASRAATTTLTGVGGDISIDGTVISYADLVAAGSVVGANGARIVAS